MDNPKAVLNKVSGLLKTGGIFYGIIPNVYANWADFLVIDHVNHFSHSSLKYFLSAGGLSVAEIDDTMHESAFVFVAKKIKNNEIIKPKRNDLSKVAKDVYIISNFWSSMAERIRRFEDTVPNKRVAIYGSGFYGTFIASNLKNQHSLVCFIDRNPYRQNQALLGKPIIDPQSLPIDAEVIYVGLNPRLAKTEMLKVKVWENRSLEFFYL